MWTPTTRHQHSRFGLRYGSDLTDAEWAILAPFLPAAARCGRRRAWPMREIVNAICYVLRGGIAWRLLRASRACWPFVQLAFADSGYQRPRVAGASTIRVQIVRKPEGQVGFAVHARRWVVERFFAWINRNRRLATDVEATIASAEAFLYAASAIILLPKLAR